MEKNTWIKVKEVRRTYCFPGLADDAPIHETTVHNSRNLFVHPSGVHCLSSKSDTHRVIVKPGWTSLEIEVSDKTSWVWPPPIPSEVN